MTNPATVNGIWFPSQQAVATHYGVSNSYVCRRLQQGVPDALALPRKQRHGAIAYDGVTYPSAQAMRRATGMSWYAMRGICQNALGTCPA